MNNKRKKIIIAATAVILLAAAVVFLTLNFNQRRTVYAAKVANNVYYRGQLMSGKSFEEVDTKLAREQQTLESPVLLNIKDTAGVVQAVQLDVKKVGLNLDVQKASTQIESANQFPEDLWKTFKILYLGEILPKQEINLDVKYDEKKLTAEVKLLAKKYSFPAQNAKVLYGTTPKIVPEKDGRTIDTTETAVLIAQTITSLNRTPLEVSTKTIKPKVSVAKLPRVILVSRAKRTIRLFDNKGKLIKTYRCAVGQSSWPTPRGDFKVVTKLKNSSWYNPHSAWSSGMPDVIGPGPSNPMGVRKIGINYPGIFMHGIPSSEYGSIGTAASHGCMRMMPKDVLDLFGRVQIGTLVFIR